MELVVCDCVLVRRYAGQTRRSHTGVCGYLAGTRVLRLQPPPVPADTLTRDPLRVTKPLSNTKCATDEPPEPRPYQTRADLDMVH